MSKTLTNRLLDSLSEENRNGLMRLCVEVDLPLRKPLYEPGIQPFYAHFLTSGIASVVTTMADGGTAEVGLIGREGVVGSLHLLGPANLSTSCFIQLEATALRIRYEHLMQLFRENEEIRDRILECVQEQGVGLGQLAGCNRLHENDQRLARWLLMAQDRTGSDTLNFTQEFLAMMLGVRRTSVSLIAGDLQRKGLVKYQRGRVRILDRKGLEAASCDCYEVFKHLYSSLYSHAAPEAAKTVKSTTGAPGGKTSSPKTSSSKTSSSKTSGRKTSGPKTSSVKTRARRGPLARSPAGNAAGVGKAPVKGRGRGTKTLAG